MNLFTKQKLKEFLLYLIFGIMTTILNTVVYASLYGVYHWTNLTSNLIAWILAVTFAFITNKLWVFKSKSINPKVILSEVTAFLGCRIATGVIDMLIMFLFVDIGGFNAYIMKIISNVFVIILNYIASKIIVFKR